jgi:hypothetical protein
MGVRNCAEIGDNLHKIITRLLANDDLVNLLYYTDKDPLNQPKLSDNQKKKEVFEKLIKIVPRIGPKETAHSLVAIRVASGSKNLENTEFRNISIIFDIFIPLTQWILKDENLRPFKILGEIEKSLDGKTINGLGKMRGGDFNLNFLTEELCCYTQNFEIIAYA